MLKQFVKILVELIIVIITFSCSEDFLERTPYSNYTLENYFQNEEQITNAVNGLYPILRGHFQGAVWKFEEFRSDNTTFQYNPADRGRQPFEAFDYFEASATSGDINGLWGNAYVGIARANMILEHIDEINFSSDELKNQREAEARFIRAFMFYHLTKFFGDVPMVIQLVNKEEVALAYNRTSIDSIQQQVIIPDLEFAIEYLKEVIPSSERGRAGKAAAQMLLARIYFMNKDYQSALPILNEITQSGVYSLETNYRDVFDPNNEKANREVIFATQYSIAADQGNIFIANWLPNNSGTELTGGMYINGLQGRNIPTQDLISKYEDGDQRYEASIGVYNQNTQNTPYVRKFLFTPLTTSGCDTDFPVFRYAETILMQAEAMVKTTGGLPDICFENINFLRARAGLPSYSQGNPIPHLNIDTEEKLVEAIKKERRIELAFEGVRYTDLIRYGELQTVMKAHGVEMKNRQSYLSEYPTSYTKITNHVGLPAEQVKLYGYKQNTGW